MMVKNLREKRSVGGGGGLSERPRRSAVLVETSENVRASTKKTRSSLSSSRRTKGDSPDASTDQFDDKNSVNESPVDYSDDENLKDENHRQTSVSFSIKDETKAENNNDEDEEEDDLEDIGNETLQGDSENGVHNKSSAAEKRNQSLQLARSARKFRRKRRKSHQKHTEKMNTSICNESTISQSQNAPVDLLKSQKYVQVNHVNRILNLNAFEPIECAYDLKDTKDTSSTTSTTSSTQSSSNKPPQNQPPPPVLPKVNIEIRSEFPECTQLYRLPTNYIKFVEKTNEELDDEVEYDMDEEDDLWLKLVNEQRQTDDSVTCMITQEQFEILMDRLEKESYFQTSNTQASKSPEKTNRSLNDTTLSHSRTLNDSSNEDALCCICLDGEGYNSNAILFCDMCNLAVHQECYGVPYIPEGQWLCRRCIQSPSAQVQCILCPNRYGAFKQTDSGLWAHVFCAIWIPEVHFANTVFLEPVIGIENIDRARWKLMCYICRKRNVGACIQCDKFNCYTAFHVTCAQQAGLYMNIREEIPEEEVNARKKKNGKKNQKNGHNSSSGSLNGEVRRCAYCDIHTPLEVLSPRTRKAIGVNGNTNSTGANMGAECEEAMKNAQKARMKKARKILAERRNAPPQVCMPVIPKEKTQDIIARVEFPKKEEFFEKLTNYWLLKRYSRNGVPMLRRLQTMGLKNKKNEHSDQKETKLAEYGKTKEELTVDEKTHIYDELKEQLLYWKRLRQDLEKARLLMELIRKRERVKRDQMRVEHLKAIYEINSLNGIFLQRLINLLREMDKSRIFYEPVDVDAVPTYYDTIKQPMDFSKMQEKLNSMVYESIEEFEADFNLIISNCMQFNQKKSFYYNLAYKMRDQAKILFEEAKQTYNETKLDPT